MEKQQLSLGQFWSKSKNIPYLTLYEKREEFEQTQDKYYYQEKVTGEDLYTDVILVNFQVKKGTPYYIKFNIDRQATKGQYISIYLQHQVPVQKEEDRQRINNFIIDPLSEDPSSVQTIEFIFTPLDNFSHIVIEARDPYGRKKDAAVEMQELLKINNIISLLPGNPPGLVKFGIKSYPGLVMCINGEEVHVGRSGIYEMTYPIDVTFLGFVIYPEKKEILSQPNEGWVPHLDTNSFILDYQY